MKGTVYILKNEIDKFYIGSTGNLERRLKRHKKGYTQTTKNMGELVLIFKQDFESLNIARKIERKLKKFKRKDYIKRIVRDGFIKIKT